MSKAESGVRQEVVIRPPNLGRAVFRITGIAPYVQNKFSAKAREMMRAKQAAGSVAKKGKQREAKDFQACYEQAMYKAEAGWHGMPASAFRCALISACRLVNFKMTLAKLSVFVEADGIDKEDGTPIIKILSGKPRYTEMLVRNETGVADIRARPMWDAGWTADVRIKYDADQFTIQDVTNLLSRAGAQVGIGEGRPDSARSAGMGWGLFEVEASKK